MLWEFVDRFPDLNVMVLGDVMLDEYIWGQVSRMSPEAPVPVVEVERTSYLPGGAANVAVNIASLGGKVTLVGVLGADEAGEKLHELLRLRDINTAGLRVAPERPTSRKTRVIAQHQQLLRMDQEKRSFLSGELLSEVQDCILNTLGQVDTLLISDYAKGVTASDLLAPVISTAQTLGKATVVDPKGRSFSKYRGATVITPNKLEAMAAGGAEDNEQSLEDVGQNLLRQVACQAVLITQGEEGMSLFERNRQTLHLPTAAREVYDVTGAGDTVVAVFTLALGAGAPLPDCARIANEAAGLVVGRLGTAALTDTELVHQLRDKQA